MHTGRFGGYSVVELVVVIAVVAILVATALPRFFDIGTFQDRAFYDQTIGAVRYAQKLAVATRCPVLVQVTDNTSLALFRPANAAACSSGPYATAVADPATPGANFVLSVPGSLTLASTAANFSFTAAGSTAADVTITVGDRSFQVHAETGFVEEL